MKTTTTTTTTTMNFFNVLTLSIPRTHNNNNKSLLKTAITSSVYLDNIRITSDFYKRMNILNLRNLVLVSVSDDYEGFEIKTKNTEGLTLKIFYINTDRFFTLETFRFFF